MLLISSLLLAIAGCSSASPFSRRQTPDNTQPVGTNPITKFSTQFLGVQVAGNSCSHRDLGFTGHIQGKWYAIYGDTLWCAQGVTDPTQDPSGFHGIVRDSVSALTNNPLTVQDLFLNTDSPVPHQQQFVPFNASWGETNQYGFGGTSLVEVDYASATGAIYYLVNANAAGLVGAGVGKVQVLNGVPTVTERFGSTGYWWQSSSLPRYGDVAAYRDINSQYIYLWGGAPTSQTGYVPSGYVYQARVVAEDAFDLSAYEYWHGRASGWSSTPLTTFSSETAVMWGTGQGQVVISRFYGCYMFVHIAGSNVAIRTAPSPEGPWSADVNVYTVPLADAAMAYAGVGHPYLDPSGETLTISYTNSPNDIQVIKVTFSK